MMKRRLCAEQLLDVIENLYAAALDERLWPTLAPRIASTFNSTIANGTPIAQIAASQGTLPQTVRKQLKAIFAKTGTHRQAQLVALIHRSTGAF